METKAIRATVKQELREILPPVAADCHVIILTPPSPTVFIGIDEDPEAIGYDRGPQKLPRLPVNIPTKFRLKAGQNIIACSEVGYAQISLIVYESH